MRVGFDWCAVAFIGCLGATWACSVKTDADGTEAEMDSMGAAGSGATDDTPDDGEPPAPPAELVNPVAASEGDSSLPGTDANANGVRDDVDAYIASLDADATNQRALGAFARELTKMMSLGGAAAPSKDAAYAQQVQVVRSIDCLSARYAAVERRRLVTDLKHAVLNNAQRLRAYHAADALLSGSILPRPSSGCGADVTEAP